MNHKITYYRKNRRRILNRAKEFMKETKKI